MKNVLFVDDEPRMLDALRRMLREQRHLWNMDFAVSGEQALSRFESMPFDVVVSDMRMPGMDGAQLLEEVMRRSPQTVRIILSGQSDREGMLRSIGPAHQFLAKPCDPAILKATVSRACALRDRLADERLVQLVSRIRTLPSVPQVYTQLFDEIQSRNVSLARVGEIISQDVAMSAKVLQLVNSAFFGLAKTVSSPMHATTLLGLDTMKALALSLGVFSQFDASKSSNPSLHHVVDHSLRVAMCAKSICRLHGQEQKMADDAFMAGVLHDIGQLVMMTNLQPEYCEARKRAHLNLQPTWKIEDSMLGADHCKLGAYLMGLWGLPDPIVETVAMHHYPSLSEGDAFSPLTAVHVADVLVHEVAPADEVLSLDWEYLQRIGVADRIDHWREACQTTLRETLP